MRNRCHGKAAAKNICIHRDPTRRLVVWPNNDGYDLLQLWSRQPHHPLVLASADKGLVALNFHSCFLAWILLFSRDEFGERVR